MPVLGLRDGLQAWLLLELDLGGRVVRLTSSPQPLEIDDAAGMTWVYMPGLVPWDVEHGPGAGEGAKVQIDAQPGGGDTWSTLLRRGHLIERAGVTVRRWLDGQVIEEAAVVIRGVATGAAWGGYDEPVTFAVERQLREGGVIPPSNRAITAQTWPVTVGGYALDPAAVGAMGVWVWGRPTSGTTPAYLVEYLAAQPTLCRLEIACHVVEATSVTIYDVEGGVSFVADVVAMQDLLGIWRSTVTFENADFSPELDREYRVGWDQGGGGWAPGAGEDAPWGAGDILSTLLHRHGRYPVDWGRFAALVPALNAYKLGFSVLEQVDTWTVIESILGLLGVEWVRGESGDYPYRQRLQATVEDSVGAIDCTRSTGRYDRVGRLQSTGGTIYNEFSIQYAPGGPQQRPQKMRVIGSGQASAGQGVDIADVRVRPSHWCRVSQSLYNDGDPLPMAAIVTELVHDDATADLILRDLVWTYALPRAWLPVQGDDSLDRYAHDDVVLVTDDDLELDDDTATLRDKIAMPDGTIVVQLLLMTPLVLSRRNT